MLTPAPSNTQTGNGFCCFLPKSRCACLYTQFSVWFHLTQTLNQATGTTFTFWKELIMSKAKSVRPVSPEQNIATSVKPLETEFHWAVQKSRRALALVLFLCCPLYIYSATLPLIHASCGNGSVCNERKAPWGILWSMTRRPGSFWMYACVTAY